MPDRQPPPGGPPNPEFREAIDSLAKQARAEDQQAEVEAKKRLEKRPFFTFVKVGLALIGLQILLFIYLNTGSTDTKRIDSAVDLLPPNTCNAVLYHTYWRVVAYIKENGHPPPGFEQLLGKYIDKIPTDPASGDALLYSSDGKNFDLRCPPRRVN